MDKSCRTCKFYKPSIDKALSDYANIGKCLYYPPTAHTGVLKRTRTFMETWPGMEERVDWSKTILPEVHDSHFCSFHEAVSERACVYCNGTGKTECYLDSKKSTCYRCKGSRVKILIK